MKKISFFISAYLCLLVSACSGDIDLDNLQKQTYFDTTSESTYRRSSEDAVKLALEYISTIETPQTRSSKRIVSKVEALGTQSKTRSAEQDTLLYLINFEDNQGFALISADERAMPVYALSDTGTLEINEENANVIAPMIEGAKQDVILRTQGIGGTLIPTTPPFDPALAEVVFKLGPLLTEKQNRVSPYGVYSSQCVNAEGKPALTNYTAVAMEKIIDFHHWPTHLEGRHLIKENSEFSDETIAYIIKTLGSPNYLNLNYNDANTLATGENNMICTTFESLHYYCNNFKPFTDEAKYWMKTMKRPIVIRAKGPTDNSHVWVIDGFIKYQVPAASLETQPIHYNYYNMFHCVWGFNDGNCNGYYFQNLYGFIGKPYFKASMDNISDTESNLVNFNEDIEYLELSMESDFSSI